MEFALLLPVLLLFLFGIVEFSVLFYDKAMITNASREGARFGITYDFASDGEHPTGPEIEQVVSDYCGSMLISFSDDSAVTTVVTNAGGATGTDLTVNVQYDYDWLILPNFASVLDLNLSAQTVMRLE